MNEIRSDAKSIRELLSNTKFGVDYYQREYRWEKKQVTELIEDLSANFLESHEAGNERSDIENYGQYFLGSVIISNRDGKKFIIDGQQRLTTLTLLLIYIHHKLDDSDEKGVLSPLIFSQQYGKRSYNLDVEARNECMEVLFKGGQSDDISTSDESVANILARFQDIEANMPDEIICDDTILYFSDWLIQNVYLVEIRANSDTDAYSVFESMNDRGLSLTPSEMLQGYLLANIHDAERRNKSAEKWKSRVIDLRELGKEEDADAIKAWLRSQHAKSMRQGKRGAIPRDFELIGTEFHRWVRDHQDDLGLSSDQEFIKLIEEDFDFYSRWYKAIREAGSTITNGLEPIYRNAQYNFTLQYTALLAPLSPSDSDEEILRKIRVVASFIDIMVARRIWDGRAIYYNAMRDRIFQNVILGIRRKNVSELAETLVKRLEGYQEKFIRHDLRLNQQNRWRIHLMLARMTDYVEVRSGNPSLYSDYVDTKSKNRYEIEHILSVSHEKDEEFMGEFHDNRNKIGGLLLLPKSINASLGKMRYEDKRRAYYAQNLLAKSLFEETYQNNPRFNSFIRKSGLPFRAHPQFKKDDLDARQELYRQLADQIWHPDTIYKAAES